MAPGLQMAQSVHVAFAFAAEHEMETKNWMKNSNYIAVLNIENEEKLKELIFRAKEEQIIFSIFREDDIDNQITAVVLECNPKSKLLCSGLPLALKNK